MSKRIIRGVLIGHLIMALSFVMSSQVLATGESVTIDSFDTMACVPSSTGAGIVIHVNGTDAVGIRFLLENLTKTTSDSFTAAILPSGTYDFALSIPANTFVNDSMHLSIDLLDAGNAVVASDSLAYLCGAVPTIPTINSWGIILLVMMFLGLAWRRLGVKTV